MRTSELYKCGLEDIWRRETGHLSPVGFVRKIGGSEDVIKRLKLYGRLDGHRGCVNTVHFSPSGDLLISGSDDTEIVIWDWAAKSRKLSYSSGHKSNVFQARVMPFTDDRSIVTCAADGQVRHGEILESGQVSTKKLAKHRGRAHKLAIEPGSPRTFFSCGEDGAVQHFDLREEKATKLFSCNAFPGVKHRRIKNIVGLNTIAINPKNPHYFSVGGFDEYARVYDVRKVATDDGRDVEPVNWFSPVHLMGKNKVHITCVAFSQQDELLVSYSDELIYLFDKDMGMGSDPVAWQSEHKDSSTSETVQGSKPQVYVGHRNARTVKGVNFFGPNTEYVVSGSDCGRIFIWRKTDGKLVSMFPGDREVVNCLEPHPFITTLATSGIERYVKIWTPTAEEVKPLPANANAIMEKNRRGREDGPGSMGFEGSVIMHVMRFQSRDGDRDRNIERLHMYRTDVELDDSGYGDDDNLDSGDSDDGVASRECILQVTNDYVSGDTERDCMGDTQRLKRERNVPCEAREQEVLDAGVWSARASSAGVCEASFVFLFP
ncbi:hypothetical protein R1sor_005132 [Riccia sorocarpa]|uniref:DDB1- and CUL4-associated factor 8 n=1 Tax=Riccia sorocarpa TaxID=122646 RepID=A0ABD3HN01_9MARC